MLTVVTYSMSMMLIIFIGMVFYYTNKRKRERMHILILPSWYINIYNILSGIFFKEQAESLAKYGNKVGIIAIQEINIRDILKYKKITFSNKEFVENEL